MRSTWLTSFVVLIVLHVAPCWGAERVEEVWRSAFGLPRAVSVNQADGSCWAATGGSVMHLSASGQVLSQTNGFDSPDALSVNSADGSCWVADTHHGQVVHLSLTGDELWRGSGFAWPESIAVNSADGSCWVADGELIHLSSTGEELWRGGRIAVSVSVNPTDGSCWAGSGQYDHDYSYFVVHLGASGNELSRHGGFHDYPQVSVNTADGSCWAADRGDFSGNDPVNGAIVRVSANGEELCRQELTYPRSVSANSSDGSCWAVANCGLVHLASNGAVLWQSGELPWPHSAAAVSVNSTDGSCWIADYGACQVARLSASGSELWRGGGFLRPRFLSVNASDGSCWVGDIGEPGDPWQDYNEGSSVVHLSPIGTEVWGSTSVDLVWGVSTNSTDGSCWLIDAGDRQVAHVSSAGQELWRSSDFVYPVSVSVDSGDGSCWVGDEMTRQVVHLSATGAVLNVTEEITPTCLSVNPTDGSCWVADSVGNQVVHLSSTAAVLWRGGNSLVPYSVSVDESDGSCWVTGTSLVHFSAAGEELWRQEVEACTQFAVNPLDGSCWTANTYTNEVMHFATDGTELGRTGEFASPTALSVNPKDGSCWVTDTEHAQVVRLLPPAGAGFRGLPGAGTVPLTVAFADASTNDPTSWCWGFGDGSASTEQSPSHTYSTGGRFTVTLTATGASGGGTCIRAGYIKAASFCDVAPDNWAWAAVEACTAAGIVGGYPDGSYGPDVVVTRDAMAVFVARALTGGHVPPGPGTPHFPDVGTGHWAYEAVEYAYANGIVAGYPGGKYEPDLPVDRGQMAAFMARAIVTPTGEAGLASYTPPATPSFPDVPPDFWTYKHIEYLKAQGIVGGYWDGLYHPEIVCTREQMAVFVARAFGLLPG